MRRRERCGFNRGGIDGVGVHKASVPRGDAEQDAPGDQGQPWAYRVWKQTKSSTFSTGGTLLPSQLALLDPWAYCVWKHTKSSTLRMGGVVEPSQLGGHASGLVQSRAW